MAAKTVFHVSMVIITTMFGIAEGRAHVNRPGSRCSRRDFWGWEPMPGRV